jgi:lipoprotein-anchoring transpeptidase ErfK/SrfK
MARRREKEERLWWLEEGERTFLYILISVLILAGLLFLFVRSTTAQQIGRNFLDSIGQGTLTGYSWLKSQSGELVNYLEEGLEVTADQPVETEPVEIGEESLIRSPQANFLATGIELPQPKKFKVKEETLAQAEAVVAAQLREKLARASTNQKNYAIIKTGKYIDIDISSQTLTLFRDGQRVNVYSVSTGSSRYPTPLGVFQINNKATRAYSAEYNLYMPYWMAFVGSTHGIHELPEYANGYKEGREYLGQAVSHGCVRLGVGSAARVYSWTPVGTPVVVHY